jgi:hypothetical protein
VVRTSSERLSVGRISEPFALGRGRRRLRSSAPRGSRPGVGNSARPCQTRKGDARPIRSAFSGGALYCAATSLSARGRRLSRNGNPVAGRSTPVGTRLGRRVGRPVLYDSARLRDVARSERRELSPVGEEPSPRRRAPESQSPCPTGRPTVGGCAPPSRTGRAGRAPGPLRALRDRGRGRGAAHHLPPAPAASTVATDARPRWIRRRPRAARARYPPEPSASASAEHTALRPAHAGRSAGREPTHAPPPGARPARDEDAARRKSFRRRQARALRSGFRGRRDCDRTDRRNPRSDRSRLVTPITPRRNGVIRQRPGRERAPRWL